MIKFLLCLQITSKSLENYFYAIFIKFFQFLPQDFGYNRDIKHWYKHSLGACGITIIVI